MPKLSKTAGIKLIVAELQKGIAKVSIMAYFGNKWQTPKDTFNKWYAIALAQYNEAQISINKQKAEDYKQSELNAQKGLILSREKVLEMTSNVLKVAYNNVVTKKDDKSITSFATAKAAYTKLCGMDLPDKIANTDSEGNDLIEIGDPAPLFVSAN